jgi:hypothetical protein
MDLGWSCEGQPACQESHEKDTLQGMLVHVANLPSPRSGLKPSWPDARERDDMWCRQLSLAAKRQSPLEPAIQLWLSATSRVPP